MTSWRSKRHGVCSIATVVTVDGTPYLDWQARLLAFSHQRARQPGALHVLERRTEVDGDYYPPYNRPVSLGLWAEKNSHTATVVVLDPDMVFVRPLTVDVPAGTLFAHDGRYPMSAEQVAALRPYAAEPAGIPIPIVPMVLSAGDLARLAAPWFDYTVRLRADNDARRALGWLCEMWACALAVRAVGLHCELRSLATIPPLSDRRAPLVHYAWTTACFDKRTYRPWAELPRCPHPGHLRMDRLIRDLREMDEGEAPAAIRMRGDGSR